MWCRFCYQCDISWLYSCWYHINIQCNRPLVRLLLRLYVSTRMTNGGYVQLHLSLFHHRHDHHKIVSPQQNACVLLCMVNVFNDKHGACQHGNETSGCCTYLCSTARAHPRVPLVSSGQAPGAQKGAVYTQKNNKYAGNRLHSPNKSNTSMVNCSMVNHMIMVDHQGQLPAVAPHAAVGPTVWPSLLYPPPLSHQCSAH